MRAIRHSSPSETLINISFAIFGKVLSGRGAAIRGTADAARVSAGDAFYSALAAPHSVLLWLKSLGDDLPRLFAQEMHHLSFAVETHHATCDVPCVLHRGRADDLLDLRDVRAVHAE